MCYGKHTLQLQAQQNQLVKEQEKLIKKLKKLKEDNHEDSCYKSFTKEYIVENSVAVGLGWHRNSFTYTNLRVRFLMLFQPDTFLT